MAVIPVTPGSGANVFVYQDASSNDHPAGVAEILVGTTPTAVSATNPVPSKITDGTNSVSLFQGHNADNQSFGSGYGINTTGVAQLLNPAGGVDRQRETGFDGIPSAGVASGAQQFAVPLSTTIAANVAAGANQVVTPASMAGIFAGSSLKVANSNGTNAEVVFVTAVTATTFTATFAQAKTGPGITVNGFYYNQARDAAIGDAVALVGLSASATYLWNKVSNAAELERSAAAELDNASGNGTAIAAGYEFNAIGFDRERNLMGKGLTQATITATAGGDSTLTFSADPSLLANGGLKAGAYLVLSTGLPSPLVGDLVQVSATYASGTSVPVTPAGLTSSIAAGRTRASFSSQAAFGPGTAGFIPDGIGIEEEALYDPVSGLYYIERSATQDGVAGTNIVLESLALYNGTTFDRARSDGPNGNLRVTSGVSTSGGATPYSLIAANTTNATSVKASAGQVYGYGLFNTTASPLYVKFYDSATAPTAGSGTPVRRVMVPANGGVERPFPSGIQFLNGIGFTATANPADSDATAVAANSLLINIDYK